MCLRLSGFGILSFCCIISTLLPITVPVNIPADDLVIHALEGERNVTLPCQYFITETFGRRQIAWNLDDSSGPPVILKTSLGKIIPSYAHTGRVTLENESSLVLINPLVKDSGIYVCTVNIPEDNPSQASSVVHLKIVQEVHLNDPEVINSTSVLVKWLPPDIHHFSDPVVGYKVYYRKNDTGLSPVIRIKPILDASQTEYIITELEMETMYAVNVVGYGATEATVMKSKEVFFKTSHRGKSSIRDVQSSTQQTVNIGEDINETVPQTGREKNIQLAIDDDSKAASMPVQTSYLAILCLMSSVIM